MNKLNLTTCNFQEIGKNLKNVTYKENFKEIWKNNIAPRFILVQHVHHYFAPNPVLNGRPLKIHSLPLF